MCENCSALLVTLLNRAGELVSTDEFAHDQVVQARADLYISIANELAAALRDDLADAEG